MRLCEVVFKVTCRPLLASIIAWPLLALPHQVNSKLAHRLDIMTPRPMWRKLADHGLQVGKAVSFDIAQVFNRTVYLASWKSCAMVRPSKALMTRGWGAKGT